MQCLGLPRALQTLSLDPLESKEVLLHDEGQVRPQDADTCIPKGPLKAFLGNGVIITSRKVGFEGFPMRAFASLCQVEVLGSASIAISCVSQSSPAVSTCS